VYRLRGVAVDTIATVHVLLIASVVALSAVVAALWPRVACRLAVAIDQPPRASCPRCQQPFAGGWRGWVRLGAPCPACSAWAKSWLAAGGCAAAATAALTWRTLGAGAGQVALLVMWLLVVQAGTLLSLIDLAAHRLPAVLTTGMGAAVGVGVVVAAWLAQDPRWILAALLGGAALGGIYLLLALLVPSQVGMGDVRLAAVLGAALGVGGWQALLLGAVLPYVVGLPFALAQLRHSPSQRGQVPFGPFLAAGAIIATTLVGG
jgi:leader peptidase (prepilin peptidase)/N-methyltransferase